MQPAARTGKTRGIVVPDRPFSFLDLVYRITGPPEPEEALHRPLVGRFAELDATGKAQSPSSWAVLHGVSASGALLIHAHPISASEVVFELDVPEKMILSAVFHVNASSLVGELVETSVKFAQQHAPLIERGGSASD
ncbi:MAG TPA: hypothetical protein VMV10_15875 [Pirellulales bacterium]|nr:hypothetical protein [Pirellulales bacterium]